MEKCFPIQCQKCFLVIWMNYDVYNSSPSAYKEDTCPHCDYRKYNSLWELAASNPKNKKINWKFDAIDFLIQRTILKKGAA